MYDAAGRQVAVIDAKGLRWSTTFDNGGRVTSQGNLLTQNSNFTYDNASRRIRVSSPLSKLSSTVFDAAGQVKAVVNPLNKRTSFAYDNAGRQVRVQNALGKNTTTVYDSAGQAVATINALGYRTTQIHDDVGRVVAVRDANNKRTTTVFDEAGRDIASIDANGNRVTQVFDAANQRTVLVDPKGNRTTFGFDDAGRQTFQANALSQRTTFGYDAANQQTSVANGIGSTNFDYDNAGRLTCKRHSDSTRVSQTFDAVGQRTLMHDSTGRTTTTFDNAGRLATRTNPAGIQLTYAFDAAGRKTGISGMSMSWSYGYDDADRVTSITGPVSAFRFYNDAGQMTHQFFSNTTRASYAYDDAGQVLRISHLKPDKTTLTSFRYTYDAAGNRTGVTEHSGDAVAWTYDNTYQLKRETRTGGTAYDVSYTYDAAGNRTLEIDSGARTTYAFNAGNQLVTEVDGGGTTSYTYDAAGNQTLRQAPGGRTTYTWNVESKVTQVRIVGGGRNTMQYDGDGKRVKKEDTSATTKQVWDEENILGETDNANTVQVRYALAPQQYGDLIGQSRISGGIRIAHQDGLGSVARLTDGTGAQQDSYIYRAFGTIAASSGSSVNPFRFVGGQGYYYDADLVAYLLRARFLGPDIGRFWSRDPISVCMPDGSVRLRIIKRAKWRATNLYEAFTNNPISYADPSGLIAVFIEGTWGDVGKGKGTIIHDLFTKSTEKAADKTYIVGHDFPLGNPNKQVQEAYEWIEKNLKEPGGPFSVDIFGFSAGAVQALRVAELMKRDLKAPVRFLALIDAVSIGIINANKGKAERESTWKDNIRENLPDEIPDTVGHVLVLRKEDNTKPRTKDEYLDVNIYRSHKFYLRKNYTFKTYALTHTDIANSNQIVKDVIAAAKNAGALF